MPGYTWMSYTNVLDDPLRIATYGSLLSMIENLSQACSHADMEKCRHHADMQTCRHADMQTCRHADIHSYGATRGSPVGRLPARRVLSV